jgi:hypothetical protein
MDTALLASLEELRRMNIPALKQRYFALFGQESKSSNKAFLFRRLAWKLQAQAKGGLSERAQQRAAEIVDEADLRVRAPKGFLPFDVPAVEWAADRSLAPRDWRIPPPGTILTRRHGNREIVAKVLKKGFEFESRRYRSLSAIASEVTGTRWNGIRFFGLAERRNV